MNRRAQSILADYDPEIERTFRRLRKDRGGRKEPLIQNIKGEEELLQNLEDMEGNVENQVGQAGAAQNNGNGNGRRTMADYGRPSLHGVESSIIRPRVEANNFELKPAFIQMILQSIQFDGLPDEDPNSHIGTFLELCDTFKMNGVSDDAIKLRLFPFSLRDRAKAWLKSLPPGSITTWDNLAEKFLAKYFPPARTAKLMNDIFSFKQLDNESLYECWERYKNLLRRCPHHGLDLGFQLLTFQNGLTFASKQLLDSSSGGSTSSMTPEELYELVEKISLSHNSWGLQRAKAKVPGLHNVDAMASMEAKLEAMQKQITNMNVSSSPRQAQVMACDFCGANHPNHECQHMNLSGDPSIEQVDYVGNSRQGGNPYSNTYNPGWRNHPNFSWGNQGQTRPSPPQQGYQGARPQPPLPYHPSPTQSQPTIDELLAKMASSNETIAKMATTNDSRFQGLEASMRNQEASIHNLENQIGQIARMIADRPFGSLPSNTEQNPRDDSRGKH